jgi:hypothetical protein
MKKVWVSVLILTVAVAACKKGQKEYAVAFSGIVNFSQGVVKFEKEGKTGVLKQGDAVEEGTKIITVGDKSFAEIYLDQNAIKVMGNSTLTFTKLALTSSGQITDLYVQNGNVFSKVKKKLEKGDQFNVNTPHSIAAVRGTDFLVSDDGKKSNIACVEGKIEVKDSALESRSVVLDGKEEVDVAGSDLVKKQISDDRMRILKNISDIKEIQGDIRQKYEDQKNDMRRRFEEEREQMRKAVIDQKDKDKAMIEKQKADDKARIDDQKQRDKENIDAIKGTSKDAANQSVDAAKNAMDSTKADTNASKKAADDAKAAVKPNVDVNQFKKK